MVDLTRHVAIVTGASTGIGRETARGLAAMGATVVIMSKDKGRGDAAVADIRATSGNDRVSGMLGDLASIQDTRRLAAEFTATHDRLDILVNNAGIIPGERTVTADGLETAFAINHLAGFHLTRLLLDPLKAGAPSRVVMMVSATAERGDLDDLQSEKTYDGWSATGIRSSRVSCSCPRWRTARRVRRHHQRRLSRGHPHALDTGHDRVHEGHHAPVAVHAEEARRSRTGADLARHRTGAAQPRTASSTSTGSRCRRSPRAGRPGRRPSAVGGE